MFIELSEFLVCPEEHDPEHLVIATGVMAGRTILSGTIGCPVCEREFFIDEGVAVFGSRPRTKPPAGKLPPPADLQAALGLDSPGGYIALLGSAAGASRDLASLLDNVHVVAVNAPDRSARTTAVTLLQSPTTIPLRSAAMRGIIVGSEFARDLWLREAARVVLKGQRVVVLDESPEVPAGVALVASGRGMWVGAKK